MAKLLEWIWDNGDYLFIAGLIASLAIVIVLLIFIPTPRERYRCEEFDPNSSVANLPIRCLEYWENRSGQKD